MEGKIERQVKADRAEQQRRRGAAKIERLAREGKSYGLSVKGITYKPTERVYIKYREFGRLGIDWYQRKDVPAGVDKLIGDILSGVGILKPIAVARRLYGPINGRDKLWIVDGHQRYWAAWDREIGLWADVYDVANAAAERALFILLNRQSRQQASDKVRAWPGPGADVARRLADDPQSPLLMEFGYSSSSKYPASSMTFGIASVLSGIGRSWGNVERSLEELDRMYESAGPEVMWRVTLQFACLMKEVFGPQRPAQVAVVALAVVAHEKWFGNGEWKFTRPTDLEKDALRVVEWKKWHGFGDLPHCLLEVRKQWRSKHHVE